MSNQINNGGPAFPRTGADGHTSPQSGMTLRDYFAAAALLSVDQRSQGNPDDIACECYQLADAMIQAREVKP